MDDIKKALHGIYEAITDQDFLKEIEDLEKSYGTHTMYTLKQQAEKAHKAGQDHRDHSGVRSAARAHAEGNTIIPFRDTHDARDHARAVKHHAEARGFHSANADHMEGADKIRHKALADAHEDLMHEHYDKMMDKVGAGDKSLHKLKKSEDATLEKAEHDMSQYSQKFHERADKAIKEGHIPGDYHDDLDRSARAHLYKTTGVKSVKYHQAQQSKHDKLAQHAEKAGNLHDAHIHHAMSIAHESAAEHASTPEHDPKYGCQGCK